MTEAKPQDPDQRINSEGTEQEGSMSYQGHLVIDADCHIYQAWDLDRTYKENIAPEYREKYGWFSEAVRLKQHRPGDPGFADVFWPLVPNVLVPTRPLGVYEPYEARDDGNGRGRTRHGVTHDGTVIDPACNWDPKVRLRDMDTAGVDVSIIFASTADSLSAMREVAFESALHSAYHRYISDYCADSGDRLWWIGVSTMRDIPASVAQLHYWAQADPHFAGMQISRVCPDGSLLDNPDLHPLYAASQELDLPLWVHGGANRPPLTPWVDAPNGLYHSIGGQYAMAALIGGGVFDLFPKLRVGLFESFGGWMPYVLEKLDEGYKPGGRTTPLLKRTPSEIVADGNLFCSMEADEKHIAYAMEALGDDIWLFTTDYPHPGTSWPDGVTTTAAKAILESTKVKLFETNAKRFLPRLVGTKALGQLVTVS